jgi:hypothetical protein
MLIKKLIDSPTRLNVRLKKGDKLSEASKNIVIFLKDKNF